MSDDNDAVAILATLDTKSHQAGIVADRIRSAGLRPCEIDMGTAGHPDRPGDVTRAEVLKAARITPNLWERSSKSEQMAAVSSGATRILLDMLRSEPLKAVIGIGGGQGSWLASEVMRNLPFGLPKVLVSTTSIRATEYIGHSDLIFVPSITDISGSNWYLNSTLTYAASIAAAMASATPSTRKPVHPTVAMTMFGVTTRGADYARNILERAGYQVAVFHANGGGAVMERLAIDGAFVGLLDWTITELSDELVGGITSAGPQRLEVAASLGLPQIVVPGAIDVINFRARDSVPGKFSGRSFYAHTPFSTLMRLNTQEAAQLGAVVARKLNNAHGPVKILIPGGGFSEIDAVGGPFWDPDADQSFISNLKNTINDTVPVEVADYNINDPEFAAMAAEQLIAMLHPSMTDLSRS